MALPVMYKHFTGPQGMGHLSLGVLSAPQFAAEASGHEYYQVTNAHVEFKPIRGLIRLGQIAFGATNDLSRLVPAYSQFLYLEAAVPVQAVTDGAKRSVSIDLWHPIKGSRYETRTTAVSMSPSVAYAYTYGKVTDNGVEIPDGALLGEVLVTFSVRFSVIVPPALSASVNLTHMENSLTPLVERSFFSKSVGLITSKSSTQVAALGMPLGNPYWGGEVAPFIRPPDILAITSPCDAMAHLRFSLHRLVPNASASTATLIADNSLYPYIGLDPSVTSAHGSIQVLGKLATPVATTGFDSNGNIGATHTLLSTHSSIHMQVRANSLPNSLPIAAMRALQDAGSLAQYAINHPLEACLALGIGVATGGGVAGASFLISAAVLDALKVSGKPDTFLAGLQSSISGSVHTYPLGSSPDMNKGVSGSGFAPYPLAPAFGSFGPYAMSLEDEPMWVPGDPFPVTTSASFSGYLADGQLAPVPGSGGGGVSDYFPGNRRVVVQGQGVATFAANKMSEVSYSVSGSQVCEVTDPNTGEDKTAGWAVTAVTMNDPSSTTPDSILTLSFSYMPSGTALAIFVDSVHMEFVGPNGTSLPASGNAFRMDYTTVDEYASPIWSANEIEGWRIENVSGVWAHRFPDIPSLFYPTPQPPLVAQGGGQATTAENIRVKVTANNTNTTRTSAFLFTIVLYMHDFSVPRVPRTRFPSPSTRAGIVRVPSVQPSNTIPSASRQPAADALLEVIRSQQRYLDTYVQVVTTADGVPDGSTA